MASSTPFTNEGERSAPKSRASSTASSSTTERGASACGSSSNDRKAQHVAVDGRHAVHPPMIGVIRDAAGPGTRDAASTPAYQLPGELARSGMEIEVGRDPIEHLFHRNVRFAFRGS